MPLRNSGPMRTVYVNLNELVCFLLFLERPLEHLRLRSSLHQKAIKSCTYLGCVHALEEQWTNEDFPCKSK